MWPLQIRVFKEAAVEMLLGPRNEVTAYRIPDALLPGGKQDTVEVSNDNSRWTQADSSRYQRDRETSVGRSWRRGGDGCDGRAQLLIQAFRRSWTLFYRDLTGQTLSLKLLSAVFWTVPQPLDAVNCGEQVSSSFPSGD